MTKLLRTEKDVKEAVKKHLIMLGVYWFMPAAGIYGRRGIPDFICCVNGSFVAIETKAPRCGVTGLTALQKQEAYKIDRVNGFYFCVYDEASIFNMLDEIRRLTYEKTV